jgi:hypothetical protein
MGGPSVRKERQQWLHAARNTTLTTLTDMGRIAGTPQFAMKAMWIICTTAISTICTRITSTSMPSRSTQRIPRNARLKSTVHTHMAQTADIKRCRMVIMSTILWTADCITRTVIIAMITVPCSSPEGVHDGSHYSNPSKS